MIDGHWKNGSCCEKLTYQLWSKAIQSKHERSFVSVHSRPEGHKESAQNHRSRMTPSYTSYKVFKLGCIRATEGMGFNHNSSLRFHRILTPCRLNYPYHQSISVEFCRSLQMCFSMLFIFWTFIKHDVGYSKYHNLSYSTSLSSEVESRSFWLRTLVVAYKHHKMPDFDLFWHILLHRLSNINMLYNVIWYVICYNMIFSLML